MSLFFLRCICLIENEINDFAAVLRGKTKSNEKYNEKYNEKTLTFRGVRCVVCHFVCREGGYYDHEHV